MPLRHLLLLNTHAKIEHPHAAEHTLRRVLFTQGHPMTTQALWQEFSSQLNAFLTRQLHNPADAEDLRQQIFLTIHKHLSQGKPPHHVRGWVYQIARNALIDYRRRKSARPDTHHPQPLQDSSNLPAQSEPDSHITSEVARCLLSMLNHLPEPYRSAVHAADIEELPQAQIAANAGISLTATKARIQRGRSKLRDTLLACCQIEFDPHKNPIAHTCNSPCHPTPQSLAATAAAAQTTMTTPKKSTPQNTSTSQ